MSEDALEIPLPRIPERRWYCAVDTDQPSPADIVEPHEQNEISEETCHVAPRSVVVFESRATSL